MGTAFKLVMSRATVLEIQELLNKESFSGTDVFIDIRVGEQDIPTTIVCNGTNGELLTTFLKSSLELANEAVINNTTAVNKEMSNLETALELETKDIR